MDESLGIDSTVGRRPAWPVAPTYLGKPMTQIDQPLPTRQGMLLVK
jgi:hypothetical protein